MTITKHYKVEDGKVVEAEKPTPKRDWYDYGLDTGPRLRVKRILEGEELRAEMDRIANHPPQTTDREEEKAIHAESDKAFRDGDDRKLGKIYEDLLDEIHSPNLGERTPDQMLEYAWSELEAALTAELREVSRQEKRNDWGFRLLPEGLAVRCQPRSGGESLECRLDKKALKARLQHAAIDAKESAMVLVRNVRAEFDQARARMVISGPAGVALEIESAKA